MTLALVGCSSDRPGFSDEEVPMLQSDASAPDAPTGPPCSAVTVEARHRALDLFITLDRSASMVGAPWAATKRALEDFFTNPEADDVSVALAYFPAPQLGADYKLCWREAYRSLPVELGLLPAHASKLVSSLAETEPLGSTPTGIALDGALFMATRHKYAHPDRQAAVVLVSDGEPTECTSFSTLVDLPRIALAEYGTLTFAIGTGSAPGKLMNDLAEAGGTEEALSVRNASELGEGLRKAQAQAVGCEILFPETAPDGRPTDPGLVNIVITDSLGPRTIQGVGRADACGNREGWYYDDPKDPKDLRLCPASCTLVREQRASKTHVEIGCATLGPR